MLLGLIDTVNPKLWGVQLGLKLLLEHSKGDESYFAPYIRSLPSLYGTMPAFFTAADLAELQTEGVVLKARKTAQNRHFPQLAAAKVCLCATAAGFSK